MTWFLRTGRERNLLTAAVDRCHRSMIGPIFGCSARGSTADEIRTALGAIATQQLLDTTRLRWVAGIASKCCGFLKRRLCQNADRIT